MAKQTKKLEDLEKIKESIIKDDVCPDLKKGATQLVFGDGSPDAELVFIGEAPGKNEDEQGLPFVGAAGRFLEEMLNGIGLKRADVYITNVVKYRPPENRDPTPEEKEQCMPWLKLEISIIKPKVLVPLGRHALGHFFTDLSITTAHGKPQLLKNGSAVFPIYHPAAALHNPGLRSSLESDFKGLKTFLESFA